jgi:broad specificity phosphatase PhoE
MKIALVPCGETEWTQEGRLLGRVEVPMTQQGQAQCDAWAEQLRVHGLARVYHAPDELSRATARRFGRRLRIPTRKADALAEVYLGLWAGLTEEQLATRFESAHRQLLDDPLTVSPPEGESVAAAADRLEAWMRKRLTKDSQRPVALVLRPLALGLTRFLLEGSEASAVWPAAQAREPFVVESDVLLAPPQPHAASEGRSEDG